MEHDTRHPSESDPSTPHSNEGQDDLPNLTLQAGRHHRIVAGHPWVFANEIQEMRTLRERQPGDLALIRDAHGRPVGKGFFNRNALIACRMLTRDPAEAIDADFLARRLEAALAYRTRFLNPHHLRLVHAEADGFPGLIIDRFGTHLTVQINTAGFERLTETLLAVLDRVLAPATVLLRNDTPARGQEGLDAQVMMARGEAPDQVIVEEGGCRFVTSPADGQKTGWFHDHRDNRAFMAGLSRDARVLDVYSYLGGFAIQAAAAGARDVHAIDRSAHACALAKESAGLNGVAERCRFERASAFEALEAMGKEGDRFDIVIVDPPAFAKSRRDIAAARRGYQKLTRLAARLVEPGGFLLVASCSHHVDEAAFDESLRKGLADARVSGRIARRAGAGIDHPVHPFLPESAYLKARVIQVLPR